MNQEPKTNIKNIENPDKKSKKKAVNNENNLINKLFIQMKNYSLYNDRDSIINDGTWQGSSADDFNPSVKDINDLIYNSLNTGIENNESVYNDLNTDISNISKSYNYSVDMYRNQDKMNKFTLNKLDKFKKKNNHLLYDLDNKKRHQAIYLFYIDKYQAQIEILYLIIYSAIIAIILNYLNNKFKFIINDTIFIILLGILLSYVVIQTILKLFDIYYRSNINFDEYDFKKNIDQDISYNYVDPDLEEKCNAEIKLYDSVLADDISEDDIEDLNADE
tara:strand:+ start:25582 stop:26409 length:828 start_codon:yes stop_codon:yes gene_type:complete